MDTSPAWATGCFVTLALLFQGPHHPCLAHSTGLLEEQINSWLEKGFGNCWQLPNFAKSQSRVLCTSQLNPMSPGDPNPFHRTPPFLFALHLIKRPKCTSIKVVIEFPVSRDSQPRGGIFWRIITIPSSFHIWPYSDPWRHYPLKTLPFSFRGWSLCGHGSWISPFTAVSCHHLSDSPTIQCFSRADPDLISLRGPRAQVKGMAHISIWGADLDEEKEPEAQREKAEKG